MDFTSFSSLMMAWRARYCKTSEMVSMATAEASPMRLEPMLPRVKNTAIPVAMAMIWKIMVFVSHLIWAGRFVKSRIT